MELSLNKKLRGFQLISQEKLQSIICSIPGKKDLIIEPKLIKPLEHVCAASWLKLKGIQRIFKYDTQHAIQRASEDQVQIYMISSDVPTFRNILQQIKANERQQPTDLDAAVKYFHIICVPSCFAYFHTQIEEDGLYGLVQLHRFNWDFIYLDQNLLSMEISNTFSTIFIQKNTSLLPSMSHSLRVLQLICGLPDIILSLGEHATQLAVMLKHLNSESGSSSKTEQECNFDAMIIMDRDKDYASSLLTPTIYAGLLLEVFAQRSGEIDLTTDKISKQQLDIFSLPNKPTAAANVKPADDKNKQRSSNLNVIRLNSLCDEIYAENRYRHFSQASSMVRAQAKSIGVELQKLNDMNVEEMHAYVARKLPKVAELKSKVLKHLNASERVIALMGQHFQRLQTLEENILNNAGRRGTLQEIEELLATAGARYNTLRLLCLQHLCAGVTPDELAKFARNYCNAFGHQELVVFENLANCGLLPAFTEEVAGEGDRLNKSAKLLLDKIPLATKFQQTEFQAIANRLKLLVHTSTDMNEVDTSGPTTFSNASDQTDTTNANACPSYVFNRLYIPLIAQICHLLLKSNSAEDCSLKLGMLQKLQMFLPKRNDHYFATNIKSFTQNVKAGDIKDLFPLRSRNIFVFIVGGLTYAEIAACDLVSRLSGGQIVIASDTIISGADLIASAFT